MSIERIDNTLCNGCRLCVDACPMDVIRLDTLVAENNEWPPCRLGCPAGVDIRSYLYLLQEGMIDEAIDILRDSLPLPAITGRVCPHPCESECARQEVDEAVNINALERFVADYWLQEKAAPARRIYTARVAVIGSGPAGLSSAYFLARTGYPVTVFEAMPAPGGMLRQAIAEYRLPKDVLDAQINYIRDMGIEFKTGVKIGQDISFDDLKKDYQAVFLATGNQLSSRLKLEGAELDGVLWGLDFLRDVNMKRNVSVNESVAVIGGGNVAVDVALTARRLGAKEVQLACLETGEDMPAFKEEIEQAVNEGIIINTSWGPKKILGDGGKVTGIELVRCESVLDAAGKFSPSFNDREIKSIKAGTIILAVGQVPDLSFIPGNIKLTEGNIIQIDSITMETSLAGVFAGGDVASGAPAGSVVEAIAAGKRAAISIDRYLKGEDLRAGRQLRPARVKKPPREGVETMDRQPTGMLPVAERAGNFREVKIGFDVDTAHLEAQRCMTCGSRAEITYPDDCQLCLFCERDCPQKAIHVSPEKKVIPLMAWG